MQGVQPKLTSRRLLTITEAASYLNCSTVTIRRLIWAGRLPAVRWDRRIRIDIHDLERFIEENRCQEVI